MGCPWGVHRVSIGCPWAGRKDLIGEKYWKEYVHFCEEVEDNTPYIVINANLDSHLITDWSWEIRARKTVYLSFDYPTPEWITQTTAIEEIKHRTYRYNGIIEFIKERKRMLDRRLKAVH